MAISAIIAGFDAVMALHAILHVRIGANALAEFMGDRTMAIDAYPVLYELFMADLNAVILDSLLQCFAMAGNADIIGDLGVLDGFFRINEISEAIAHAANLQRQQAKSSLVLMTKQAVDPGMRGFAQRDRAYLDLMARAAQYWTCRAGNDNDLP